ncbi:hypothetical protein [Anaerovibrio sp. JC8]|uniref:hypothetical protein n=1 Tax=Anaerovibrio sp. JC8 TaxID=1240085 RepID=UPI001301DE13|nr:hypothetical protein [Anaerovibrio sp. JC8]
MTTTLLIFSAILVIISIYRGVQAKKEIQRLKQQNKAIEQRLKYCKQVIKALHNRGCK